MMDTHSLLVFILGDTRFGVDATRVRETVWLPELAPAEEAPPYIAGLFSLRGQIVPVTDLDLRFGHPARPYRTSDQIVVLELDQVRMGLIVGEAVEVIDISAETILPPPTFDVGAPGRARLVEGEVRVGDNLVTLLDAKRLMHLPHPHPSPPPLAGEGVEAPSLARSAGEGWGGGAGEGSSATLPTKHFCPQATPEQRATFRARARALMEAATGEADTRMALAVVKLEDEFFGIALDAVQEFCNIVQPCPIPCCPPHILGAISLRGNLITLLDLHAALNLQRMAQNGGKAVITHLGEQAVGVMVDEVDDVIYLHEKALQAAPQALREKHGAEVKGIAPYGGKMMAVLDLPALLAREEWIVNERC